MTLGTDFAPSFLAGGCTVFLNFRFIGSQRMAASIGIARSNTDAGASTKRTALFCTSPRSSDGRLIRSTTICSESTTATRFSRLTFGHAVCRRQEGKLAETDKNTVGSPWHGRQFVPSNFVDHLG